MIDAQHASLPSAYTIASSSIGLGFGLMLVGSATAIGLLFAPMWGPAAVVLLYLPAVLVTARYAGLLPALTVSVLATLTFDFFFTEPFHTFRITSAADLVTAAALFLIAAVISQLASEMRTQTKLAEQRALSHATIAGLARKLLSCGDREAVADVIVTDLSRLFDCHTVFAIDGKPPVILAAQPPSTKLAPNDEVALAAALEQGKIAGRGLQRVSQAEWQFNPVIEEGKILATVGLARTDGGPPIAEDQRELLNNLLDQAALALERGRMDAESCAAIAAREQNRMRAVLFASIGEEVKPRLLAIQAGARSLNRKPGDKDVASKIASETSKLQLYIDNLVDLVPGEDLEPITWGPVIIDQFRHKVTREGKDVHLSPKEFAVLAELARHAGQVLTHRHLLSAVWGPSNEDHIEYLRVAIRSLRQKLEFDPAVPVLIINELGVGYRLSLTASRQTELS